MHGDALIQHGEDLEDDAIEASRAVPFVADQENRFRHEAPPQELFGAVVTDEQQLRQAAATPDWRWRLDLATAIEDLIDAS